MSQSPVNLSSTLERDPVCGMNVNPATARHVHNHAGKNIYFCFASCVEKFKSDPDKYLNASARSTGLVSLSAKPATSPIPQPPNNLKTQSSARIPDNTVYVCPMCPEVREPKPGACPSCGM